MWSTLRLLIYWEVHKYRHSWRRVLLLKSSRLDSILVGGTAFLLFREELDEVVDAEDGDGCFSGELQTFGFDHGGLVDAGLLVVPGLSINQVQTDPKTANT